jgi:hypothetical protein
MDIAWRMRDGSLEIFTGSLTGPIR